MEINDKLGSYLASIAIVIDDQIGIESSSISKISTVLESNGVLLIKKNNLIDVTNAISNVSFIILDWDLKSKEETELAESGVTFGESHLRSKHDLNKIFIQDIIQSYFIPIFIFSQENIDKIKTFLEETPEIKTAIENERIFLCGKNEIQGDNVITTINDWLNRSMAVYTFKILDESIEKAKHSFFNEMYMCNSNWPCHVYHNLKQDNPADINSDFQEFLMASYTSTIEPIDFNADGFDKEITLSDEEIIKIYSKIKFLKYKDKGIVGPHPGDIYCCCDEGKDEYYINISASCDMRQDKYYFIKGKSMDLDKKEEKVCYYYIQNIIDKKIIQFDFRKAQISKPTKKYEELQVGCNDSKKNFMRIGRLLSPYILAIQEKYSNYIIRTGVLRDPS